MEHLFQEFPEVSQEEWIDKVTKDLKGKPIDTLDWKLSESITIKPFYTETQQESSILQHQRSDNDWQIAEDFQVGNDYKSANKELLDALMGGINAPRLFLSQDLDIQELNLLLKDVVWEYISLHFHLSKQVSSDRFIQTLQQYIQEHQLEAKRLSGSIQGVEFRTDTSLKTLYIDARAFHQNTEDIPRELARTIQLGVNQLMSSCTDETLASACSSLTFNIAIGKSYFPSIAKIRALNILWSRIIKGFGTEWTRPEIEVSFNENTYGTDKYTNMIRATTMSMAAIIGGADRLVVLPCDVLEQNPDRFSRRIARNVQHLLKLESFFDRVVDPSAGSYYIEEMTQEFVNQAWKIFLEMEASY